MSAINSKPDVAMSSPSSEVDDQHAMKKEHSEDSPHYDTFDADTVNAKSEGRVKNPLHGIPKDRLLSDVDAFVSEKGLDEHRDVIRRGALVAQNPAAYETISELSQEEVAALDRERRHKWHQPLQLYLTIFAASLGSSVQGWDQTGSNGANLSFPQEFGIPTDKSVPNHEAHEWIVGLVNAAPYIASALCGCWLSDPINQLVGRRGTIFITAIILIITPICSGLTQTWPQLFVCRLLLGIGMGAKGSTVPVYAAENAPSVIRGALVMSWQMWTAFGIFLGFAANVIVKDVGPTAWRLQLGSAFIPAVPLAIMIYMCPESPRWLMKKNRYPKAFKSLLRLRNTPLEAARDLYYIHVLLEEEKKIYSGDSYFRRIKELFTIPRTRRATIASGTVMLAQQMCGINIIAFYSSTIFFEATNSVDQSLYASLGFGAVNFLFAIPALFTIDTFGRRSLLLFAFPSMAWSLLGAGLCFLMPTTNAAGDPNTARLALISLFIFIFAAFYSTSEGPVPFTYSAEVFDSAHREVGMGWAVTVCLGFAAILSITFFRLLIVLGVTGAFGFYAGLNVMALVLIFLFVPETKQLSLEELDAVFSVPHSTFISYQTKKVIPHFVQRWVLFNRSHKLEPLIRVDESLSKKTEQSQA